MATWQKFTLQEAIHFKNSTSQFFNIHIPIEIYHYSVGMFLGRSLCFSFTIIWHIVFTSERNTQELIAITLQAKYRFSAFIETGCWFYILYGLTFSLLRLVLGLWRSSYLGTHHSLRVPFIFCGLVNTEIIIFLCSEQMQQLCPRSLPGKMLLEVLLVFLGKAGHIFPTNASWGILSPGFTNTSGSSLFFRLLMLGYV